MCKILHIKNESDLEDIDFASMALGDKIACPSLQWMKNPIAKEVYRLAGEYQAAYKPKENELPPQYSLEQDDKFNTEVVRIR